jgi:hypothetical protein
MLHQGIRVKMERAALFVTLEAIYQTAQHHIRDDRNHIICSHLAKEM